MISKARILALAPLAANLATATLALVLTAAVIKTVFVGSAPATSQPDQVKVGDRISISGAKLGPGDTVVLAVREGCVYCARSAPLYREIVKAARSTNRNVIAVLPEPAERGKSYLASLGIVLPGVFEAQLSSIRVRGTPTLLLVTEDGSVKRVWIGLQPADKNASIVRDILGPA